ncbi:hypothetical protein QCE63_18255 [Caballeronia sp. LZ065]|nr:hypothetical protein [Caballeronia sp. LZ065]MDR5781343.1 hypothetical protein [Caballeronia sp. LZ065]
MLQILALLVLGVNTRAQTLEDIEPKDAPHAEPTSALHGRGASLSQAD